MSRKRNSRTELLAPQSIDAQLAAIIERKVADILAARRGGVLEPFFQPAGVSTAIRKQQTVPQQRKWTYYFEEWGCLRCGTKERCHHSHGMCGKCSSRIYQRLADIIRAHTKNEPMPARMDAVGLAQTALAPSLKLLHGETVTVRKRAPK